ncbi:hypothetical protein JCM11251_001948 [Rhodosporidiobolus azoricus]
MSGSGYTNDADEIVARQALSEREKAQRGFAFHGDMDDELTADRVKARELTYAYNHHPWNPYTGPGYTFVDQFGPDSRQQILADLFRVSLDKAKGLFIEPPLAVDYGYNIKFKGGFYANVNCVFLDGAEIYIGDRTAFAPGVHVYTGTHSTSVTERRGWYDRALPVSIGDDCWIGGHATILPGTIIGDGCTVAAGAVCKGTYPPNSVIGGVPARVLKTLETARPMDQPGGIIDPKDPSLVQPLPKSEGRDAFSRAKELEEMRRVAEGKKAEGKAAGGIQAALGL